MSFRRFRLRAMGTDGFAVIRCVAVTGERMIIAAKSFMLSVVFVFICARGFCRV